jgi:predicted Zn-ribbon and HTH transcriptional regulator
MGSYGIGRPALCPRCGSSKVEITGFVSNKKCGKCGYVWVSKRRAK